MDALDILNLTLREHGGTLGKSEAGIITLSVPRGRMTPELQSLLNEHHETLKEAFRSGEHLRCLTLQRRLDKGLDALRSEEAAGRTDTRRYRDMLNLWQRLDLEYRDLASRGFARQEIPA